MSASGDILSLGFKRMLWSTHSSLLKSISRESPLQESLELLPVQHVYWELRLSQGWGWRNMWFLLGERNGQASWRLGALRPSGEASPLPETGRHQQGCGLAETDKRSATSDEELIATVL